MGTRILIVEDNELNRDMLSRRLIRRGFTVVSVATGEEGIDYAASHKPDVIIMDVSLPGMNGWQASAVLKDRPDTCSIPILALTAFAMDDDRENAFSSGCDDYDTKPVEIERLMQKLTGLLGIMPNC